MNGTINDISGIRYRMKAAWLLTLLLFIGAYRQVKEILVYVLSELYEFFIQHNAFKP